MQGFKEKISDEAKKFGLAYIHIKVNKEND